ncbi:MAG: type IX secretion system membrane protein PorP/SprF [Bacteroidota bacterium]
MSKPSFENIDRWFFEYTEGNLSPDQIREFDAFLERYPSLKEELGVWSDAKISPESVENADWDSLKKPVAPFSLPLVALSVGVFIVGIAAYLWTLLPEEKRYAQSELDTAIISVEDGNVFSNKILAGSGKVEAANENPGTDAESVLQGESPKVNQRSKAALNIDQDVTDENIREDKPQGIDLSGDYKKMTAAAEKNMRTTREVRKRSNTDAVAADLPEIREYLGEDRDVIRDNDAVDYSKRIVDQSNTFKRKVSRLMHKIKRMADHPVALKNTKNRYFHVPMMTGFAANAGMVGSARGNRLQMTTRNQWVGETNQQLRNTISWDGYVYALRGGLGIDLNYNIYRGNTIEDWQTGLTYSPKFSLNKNVSIEPALRFKMGVKKLDIAPQSFGQTIEMDRNNVVAMFDNANQPPGTELWYRDLGLGLMLNTKWFYAGVNVDNVGGHYNNYYSSDSNGDFRAQSNFKAIAGTEYESLNRDIRLSGYAFYQNFGALNELWAGVNTQYKWMQLGVAANNNADIAGSAGIVFNKLALHYNIDYVESQLLVKKQLSHQITLRLLLPPSRYAAKFLKI